MADLPTEQRPPFGIWLAQHGPRGGWIEDLMRIARHDPDFPRDGDPDAARAYLRTYKGSPGLLHAIDDAEIEWMIS